MFKTVQKLLIKFFYNCRERNCLHNSIKLPDLQFTFLRLFRLLTYICADIVVFLHSGQVLNSDIILLHQSESHFLERNFQFQTEKNWTVLLFSGYDKSANSTKLWIEYVTIQIINRGTCFVSGKSWIDCRKLVLWIQWKGTEKGQI